MGYGSVDTVLRLPIAPGGEEVSRSLKKTPGPKQSQKFGTPEAAGERESAGSRIWFGGDGLSVAEQSV